MSFIPRYIELYDQGLLSSKARRLRDLMERCVICPHRCGVNRTSGKAGKCRGGELPIVSSHSAHFGEESCLVGKNGSGTIFFTNCNLACIYCQNYDISHLGRGEEISYEELADIMLSLQQRGCHNINFVTPTHMVYPILKALELAVPRGLRVPLVYNSGGYDAVVTLAILEGVFDIYMPDFKYMDPDTAEELSGARDYPAVASAALREMYRQTGDLTVNSAGVAEKGLLVRHLVLPNNRASTDLVIAFIAGLSRDTYLNLMDQYRPEYRARECFDLRRRVTLDEFDEAVAWARRAGIKRLDKYR
ncbi:MAG TPA: radical SAM protein [Spirochaetes bacterium]|nr:radical SAM protein [Spirochaetota bacterium]